MSKTSNAKKRGTIVSKDPTIAGPLTVVKKNAIVPKGKAKAASALQTGPDRAATDSAYARQGVYDLMNMTTHAAMAKFTLGIAPSALALAYFDWATHLATSPGKQLELVEKALSKYKRLAEFAGRCASEEGARPCIDPLPQDGRFRGEAWRKWPFNLLHQSFLLQQQWWHNAMTDVPGMTSQ